MERSRLERLRAAPQRRNPHRWLWQPWLYIALGLHGAVFFLPWPAGQTDVADVQPEPEAETIKITTVETPVVAPALPVAAPGASVASAGTRSSARAPLAAIAPPATALDNNSGASATRAGQATTTGQTGGQIVRDFFQAFPKYPNAPSGSAGILRPEFEQAAYLFNTGDDLGAVGDRFQRELLPDSDFTWQPQTQDADFHVYQVRRDSTNKTGYLHLIRQDDRTVLYLETRAYTLDQLHEADTEPMDTDAQHDFLSIFSAAIGNIVDFDPNQYDTDNRNLSQRASDLLADLDNPGVFSNNGQLDGRFELRGTVRNRTSTEVASELSQFLEGDHLSEDYETEHLDTYGGGELYKVIREDAHLYLVVAQARDEVVILSTESDPRPS